MATGNWTRMGVPRDPIPTLDIDKEIRAGRSEENAPCDGKFTFLAKRLFPGLVDFIMSRDVRKAERRRKANRETAARPRPPGNSTLVTSMLVGPYPLAYRETSRLHRRTPNRRIWVCRHASKPITSA